MLKLRAIILFMLLIIINIKSSTIKNSDQDKIETLSQNIHYLINLFNKFIKNWIFWLSVSILS